jgi:6-phosphofructokinase 1
MPLTPNAVVNIHERGGVLIGSSRGPQDINEIVDTLERMNIGILFMIGGAAPSGGHLAGRHRAHPRT